MGRGRSSPTRRAGVGPLERVARPDALHALSRRVCTRRRGWYQMKTYGTGLLLCVGAHTNDSPHWALQLKYPSSVTCLEQDGPDRGCLGDAEHALLRIPPAEPAAVEGLLVRRRDENTDPTLKDETGRLWPGC